MWNTGSSVAASSENLRGSMQSARLGRYIFGYACSPCYRSRKQTPTQHNAGTRTTLGRHGKGTKGRQVRPEEVRVEIKVCRAAAFWKLILQSPTPCPCHVRQ